MFHSLSQLSPFPIFLMVQFIASCNFFVQPLITLNFLFHNINSLWPLPSYFYKGGIHHLYCSHKMFYGCNQCFITFIPVLVPRVVNNNMLNKERAITISLRLYTNKPFSVFTDLTHQRKKDNFFFCADILTCLWAFTVRRENK